MLFFYYNVLSIYCTFSVLVLLHVVIGVASALLDTLYDGDGNECVLTDDDDKEGEDEEEDVEEVEDDDDDDSVWCWALSLFAILDLIESKCYLALTFTFFDNVDDADGIQVSLSTCDVLVVVLYWRVFTVIAYALNGDCSCRMCVIRRWFSDLRSCYALSRSRKGNWAARAVKLSLAACVSIDDVDIFSRW